MTKRGKTRLAQARAHDAKVFHDAETYLNRGDVRSLINVLSRACNAANVLGFLKQAKDSGKLTAEEVLQVCAVRDNVSALLARSFTKAQIDELLAAYEIAIQRGRTAEANGIKRSLRGVLGGSMVEQLLKEREQNDQVAEHPFDALSRLAREKDARRGRRRR